jgi:hypothetical protein
MELQDSRRVITAREAEKELGIPAGTIRAWASEGKLLCRSIGSDRQRWYLLSDVLELRAKTTRRAPHTRPNRRSLRTVEGHIA